ncbi:AraC family transcriptional regulator [uncultured Ferrovibrio sp.]|jgi:AraC family transcriptional regulator|uniref:helix-turn-helix domain-containing protein n=1 Tax=uncultured Ferrovibrio sp. TaxID=1576913 RepID=UPI00262CF63A|nr:AraC family transcriptional regulator [uncultured Ferrovibrio sp.]
MQEHGHILQGRRIDPLPVAWQSFAWSSGRFDMARRPFAKEAGGRIAINHHLILVTLSGGARRCQVATECGHRYDGEDFAGAVSFIPAGCSRHVMLQNVQSEWASISLRPDLLDLSILNAEGDGVIEIPAFTNVRDPLIFGMLTSFAQLRQESDSIDASYADAMTLALARHLMTRYGQGRAFPHGALRNPASWKLPPWRLRRIADYVEAHLDKPIQVGDLAAIAGLSVGHFHRALQATISQTPLDFITSRRIARARQLLAEGDIAVTELSLLVGFSSPSHFARLFRRATGVSPSEYRKGLRPSGR